jgi:radical SAM protein with 4Fe4S-binding SPASM domain
MAEVKPSYDPNRQKLRDTVPYDSPLSMYVEPTRHCNLKCFYCMHATRGVPDGALDKMGFKIAHMDMDLWDKLITDIMRFPSQPKRVCFSGIGEPLTNPHLPEMGIKLRQAGFVGRIDVITNGVLLTPKTSDALVDAGFNRIQISVQGLTGEKSKLISGVAIDMDAYVKNIAYLYKNKKSTDIFIKIIDANLENEEEKKQFFDMFTGLCDTIFVEHLVVMQQQMGDHGGRADITRNLNNEVVEKRIVCAPMFYFLQVNIDGDTYPCSTPGLPSGFSMGNAHEYSLLEIWNGARRNKMIRTNLTHGYAVLEACSACSSCVAIYDDTEYLDDCREEVLARFPSRG